MTTDERLEKLERELSRAKRRIGLVLAGVGLALGLCAAIWIVTGTAGTARAQVGGQEEKIIRANKIILEDANGKPRVGLGVNKNGPGLAMFDENGKARAILAVTKDGPELDLADVNGRPRVKLSVTKNGPELVLDDENGKDRAALFVDQEKDWPSLFLFDADGKLTWKAP